jgi:hypothetical protein
MTAVKPQPGDPAPDFSMEADDGSTASRESLLGKRYVLYFYPKDDTPGCTAQACSMRDNYEQVLATGIEVYGVSPDSVKSHVKFRAKYDLPYPLGREDVPGANLPGRRALELHHRPRRSGRARARAREADRARRPAARGAGVVSAPEQSSSQVTLLAMAVMLAGLAVMGGVMGLAWVIMGR